tara:strand:+ start:16435 stop:17562 length:1128 start_codon:yes stop_codon:yes gene_type:complete
MKNILITGGAGFIGSCLCQKLFDKGYNITIFDNLSSQVHGNTANVLFKKLQNKSAFIKGDVRNIEDWRKAIKGQEIIVHLAAETGTGQSMYKIARYNEVNVMGTAHMLELLTTTDHQVKKIIVGSSRAIYGEGKYYSNQYSFVYPSSRKEKDLVNRDFNVKCPVSNLDVELVATDEESKQNPLSIYAITKQQQEQMIMLMGKTLDIPSVSLRFQNVYGPGQSLINPYTGILSIFSTRILNGNDIDIYEDGLESRDFVYIDDVVDATILAIEKEEANGEVFNVGSGSATSVKEVAQSLKKHYNADINILISGNYRLGDIRHNYADISKIEEVLGFKPKYTFEEGLVKFVEWVQHQGVHQDNYDITIQELKNNGLMK